MTEFVKYQSVERLGTTEVDGIMEGECYIFPKIDGTNATVWRDLDGNICAGSRNRALTLDADNAGFFSWASQDTSISNFFILHPRKRLFGEWLVPHSLKTYRDDAWRKFYVFDVFDDETGRYVHYEDYRVWLDAFNIQYIPPIFKVERPTEERIYSALEMNDFLVRDGEGKGEGVVVKNYGFQNRFGRTVWAKVVTSEFKAKHTKALGVREVKEKARIEDSIAAEFVTHALVEKTFAKISQDGWTSKKIPQLLNTVYYDIVNEDMWEIVKKYKTPSIDFKALQHAVFGHVKVYKPELFA